MRFGSCIQRVQVGVLRHKNLSTPIRSFSIAHMSWSHLIRFEDESGSVKYGDAIYDESGAISSARIIEGEIFGNPSITDRVEKVGKLLAPVLSSEIIGIGLNYVKHAEETGQPLPTFPIVFRKGISSIQNPEDPIRIPKICSSPSEVDYECELAVIIGKKCRDATEENALDYVLGYTCANDVSARTWQLKKGGSQWTFGKCFDTFLPLGPVIASPAAVGNPSGLRISTTLNGNIVQDSNTSDMIFNIPKLISFLSQSTTLLPGTVIITGTPSGVGVGRKPQLFLQPGDSVTIEIEKIGKLTNPVENDF